MISTLREGPHAPVIESAGGLVWRVRDGVLQVQVVHRPKYDDWSWPKGKLDDGESFQGAAVREVAEETGKPVVLGRPLPGLQYLTPEGRVKHVRYWASRRARRSHDSHALAARAPVPAVDPGEIDACEWLAVDDAAERLTRESDRAPLDALVRAHEQGTLATRALVVARHGRAVARTAWHGADRDRPLTPLGHAQAAAMVPLLAAYGVALVVSSRWERCATTIDPYVKAAGVRPTYSENLTEAQHERSPSRVASVLAELLEDNAESAVICTHRPVLPTVLAALARHAPRDVAALLPARDPFLEPGEAVVAHVADGGAGAAGPRVVAVERLAPPLF